MRFPNGKFAHTDWKVIKQVSEEISMVEWGSYRSDTPDQGALRKCRAPIGRRPNPNIIRINFRTMHQCVLCYTQKN